VVGEVLTMAENAGKRVTALCGSFGTDLSVVQTGRFDGISVLANYATDVGDCIRHPERFISAALRDLLGK
jgi:glycerate kinase